MVRPRRKLLNHHILKVGQEVAVDVPMYIYDYDKESHHYILRPDTDYPKAFAKDIYYPANSKLFGNMECPTFMYVLNPNIGLHPQTIDGHGKDFFQPEKLRTFDEDGRVFWKHLGEGGPGDYFDFENSEDGRKSFISTTDSYKEWIGLEICEKLVSNTISPFIIAGIITRIYYMYPSSYSTSISDRPSDKLTPHYIDNLSVDTSGSYPEISGFGEDRIDWLENESIVVIMIDDSWEIHVPFSIVKPFKKIKHDQD